MYSETSPLHLTLPLLWSCGGSIGEIVRVTMS